MSLFKVLLFNLWKILLLNKIKIKLILYFNKSYFYKNLFLIQPITYVPQKNPDHYICHYFKSKMTSTLKKSFCKRNTNIPQKFSPSNREKKINKYAIHAYYDKERRTFDKYFFNINQPVTKTKSKNCPTTANQNKGRSSNSLYNRSNIGKINRITY